MNGVRERLESPRFWWRAVERERPRAPAPARPDRRARFAPLDTVLSVVEGPEAPRTRRGRSWIPVTLGAALLLGGAAFAIVSRAGTLPASAPLSAHVDELMIMAGLGVDEIHVTGYAYTEARAIFAALDLDRPTSLLRYNPEAARQRVEALPWVWRATVTRVLPDTVEVRVIERTPIALWLREGSASLVDGEGRELARVPASTQEKLPRISGAGAPEAAARLFAALRQQPALAARVRVSERVGERRWSLELDNGSRIHLPAEGESAALARLVKLADSAGGLLSQPGRVIDLRIDDRIAVAARPAPQAASSDPAPAAIPKPRKSASAL